MNTETKIGCGCLTGAVVVSAAIVGGGLAVIGSQEVAKRFNNAPRGGESTPKSLETAKPTETAVSSTKDQAAVLSGLLTPTTINGETLRVQMNTPTPEPVKKAEPTATQVTVKKDAPIAPTAVKVEAPKTTASEVTDGELLSLIPGVPELVKGSDDPQASKVPNMAMMLFDSRDSDNPMKALGDKVAEFAAAKKWNIIGRLKQWYYPLPVINNNGETGSDTWAYAENIIEAQNLSVYEKAGVTGQTWFRLPKGVERGHMTVAFAVNKNYESDKTGGRPDVAPAVIVRNTNNPGQNTTLSIMDVYPDGRVFRRKDAHIGLPYADTDNLIVHLARDGATTVITYPVVGLPNKQQEGSIELGSDYSWNKALPSYNELNRSMVSDVDKQLR